MESQDIPEDHQRYVSRETSTQKAHQRKVYGIFAVFILAAVVVASPTVFKFVREAIEIDAYDIAATHLTDNQLAQPKLAQLFDAAFKMRRVGAIDPLRINGFFAAPDTTPLDTSIVHSDEELQRDVWRLFFTQSQMYLGAGLSDEPLVGFYNPFADFWLLTRWQNDENESLLVDTALYPGSFLRPGEYDPDTILPQVPKWLHSLSISSEENPVTIRDSLQEQTAASIDAFLSAFPSDSEDRPATPEIFDSLDVIHFVFINRMVGLFETNIEMVSDEPLREVYLETTKALAAGDWDILYELNQNDGDLGGLTSVDALQLLSRLSPSLLRELEPMLSAHSGDSWTILSGRSDSARFFVETIFTRQSNGTYILDDIGAVDLYAEAQVYQ